jgi:predicted helicase
MRASLMKSFDDLYVLDLHGNSKKKERTPDGGKDENVFDIQQGVAIALFVRLTTRAISCTVRRADFWGTRAQKSDWLAENDVTSTAWEDVTPQQPPWLFLKQNADLLGQYRSGWSIPEIFNLNGDPAPGFATQHDEFAISYSPQEAKQKVEFLLNTRDEKEARERFSLCNLRWPRDFGQGDKLFPLERETGRYGQGDTEAVRS